MYGLKPVPFVECTGCGAVETALFQSDEEQMQVLRLR